MPRRCSLRAPSFAGLRPASVASSNAKKRNRKTETAHEIALRKSAWQLGLRYRKNVRTVLGVPDLVFPRQRVAVFCDGDFWHGHKWKHLSSRLLAGTNAPYWSAKISSNIERDRRITRALRRQGWTVLRFWESEIKKKPDVIAVQVRDAVSARARSQHSKGLPV
jgi:DNA mismatch endonuclease (patch repair protein)